MKAFEWTDDMREVSAFGGRYELCCRVMISAGCNWLCEHPNADPRYLGFGVPCRDDNADAKELTQAILEPARGRPRDEMHAMHQTAVSHIFLWRQLGSWIAYQSMMRELKRQERQQ